MKLLIICGHGGSDPGATGYGYKEAELVRLLGKRIKELGGDNVILGDTSHSWCKKGTLKTYKVEAGTQILELHMDSADSKSAKGGHVIYNGRFNADKYDKALANFIATQFPGRVNKLVARTDLYNLNVAGNRGISYRLMECGFISNKLDVTKFNKNIDTLAKGILECFGIKPIVKKEPIYYKKYTGKSDILDTVLIASGVPKKYTGSWKNRKPLAKKNGITVYVGSVKQNTKLISLAKQGKLKRV